MILFLYFCLCVVILNACEQHQSCRACIRDFGACVWCSNETITGPRCISEKSMPQNWCPGELENPKSSINERRLQANFSSSSEEIIQIQPQRIEMKLRPGQAIDFKFSYNAADDYPVDIYFLCDAFMNSELRKKLEEQTIQVVKWIQDITNKASVGFGTFTDKNAVPFTSIKNNTLMYSFKHLFSLSSDVKAFAKVMKEANKAFEKVMKEANNADSAKVNTIAGFDALAQVMACDEIGWRNTSRKVVVFVSDHLYHAAGDGKAAAIVNPYDGGCYLKEGTYNKELKMDYPSTSIINKLALDRAVTIVFVIDTVKSKYGPLEKVISGAHVIYPTRSRSNPQTVASEILKIYESITKKIQLKVSVNPKYANKIKVKFNPDCDTKICEVGQNKQLQFNGTIKVLEYFEADDIKVTISITGIRDNLTLDINLVNECNCKIENDDLCNGGGKRHCGICECHDNRSGIHCECSSANGTNVIRDKSTCIKPNGTIECSGRGSCICGACKCGEKRYRGRYCECDDQSCPKDKNGRMCGNGRCECGECICDSNWIKTSQRLCSCDASKDRCHFGAYECSDYGDCECNQCKCRSSICEWDARSSQGLLCNPLPCLSCHERQCRLLEPYALSRNERSTDCERRVNVTSAKEIHNDTFWMLCTNVRSDVGCYTNFVYRYDAERYGIHLIVQSKHNCAESAYIYGGTCLGLLILIGLLTLAGWKILTVYRDRKEYTRFLKEYEETLKSSEQQLNPFYNSANTTVNNPNYKRRSSCAN